MEAGDMRNLTVALSVAALLLVTACTTNRHPIADPLARQEAQLAAVKEAAKQAVLEASATVTAAKQAELAAKDQQLQAAADSNAGAQLAASSVPGRVGEVVRNEIDETAAVLPAARLTVKQVQVIQDELNEAKVSNQQLAEQHVKDLAAAEKLRVEVDAAKSKATLAENALSTVQSSVASQVQTATEQLADAAKQQALIAREAEANARDKAALDTKLMYLLCGTGILLLLGAAAICLPQLGGPHPSISVASGAVGVLLIGLGYYIPQIPLWVPIVAGVVIALSLPVGMIWAFRRGLFTELPEKIGDIPLPK